MVIGIYLGLRDSFPRFIAILLCSLDEWDIPSTVGVSVQLCCKKYSPTLTRILVLAYGCCTI